MFLEAQKNVPALIPVSVTFHWKPFKNHQLESNEHQRKIFFKNL
jgi:hypothetical protein